MTVPNQPAPEIVLLTGPDAVAEALSSRLLARLAELQSSGHTPQVGLTGGRIATRAYQRLAADGAGSAVDWSRVDLWWGDERFVPADDADRNAEPVLAVLTGPLDVPAERLHPMPARGPGEDDLDAAAARYAAELGSTAFDICLLGLGPDGHVASLFPDHPSSRAPGAVIAVRDAPKPPPDRISLTLEVVNRSQEVWFVVSGADKAEAASRALQSSGVVPVPGAGAHGLLRTVWLVDAEAASRLPAPLLERGLTD